MSSVMSRARISNAQVLPQPSPSFPSSRSRGSASPRLTWTFAICALFSMCSFFVGHVALSNWLASQDYENNNAFLRKRSSKIVGIDTQRILVLGSHHTGTSIVTKLIIEMGAFAGNDLLMLPGNPLKYFEDRETVEVDKRVLSKGHTIEKGPWWLDYGFSWSKVPNDEREIFHSSILAIVAKKDVGAKGSKRHAWVLKDPRLALLADHWVTRTPGAICVLVIRDPVETSKRLAHKYNREDKGEYLTVSEWATFWEISMITAVKACILSKSKIVFAHHWQLVQDPLGFAQKLEKDLFQEIVVMKEQATITNILGPDFSIRAQRAAQVDDFESLIWTDHLSQTWKALSSERLDLLPEIQPFSEKEAYATIITGNNRAFVAGALSLARSILRFDVTRDLVAMLSPEVDDPTIQEVLSLAGWKTIRIRKLEEPWYQTHPKCRDFTESQKLRWGRMFSKLRIYSLPYSRVVYMDTDAIVLRDIGNFFSLPGEFYAERSPSHRGINAGIMVIRPSEKVLKNLIDYAKENEPLVFWPENQVGCTEQELLNRFWHGEDFSRKLNNTRHFDYLGSRFINEVGREENKLYGPRIAHCLTTKCKKPWDVSLYKLLRNSPSYEKRAIQRICDPLMYLVWYSLFLSPELSDARSKLFESDFAEKEILNIDAQKGLKDVLSEIEQVSDSGKNFLKQWDKE